MSNSYSDPLRRPSSRTLEVCWALPAIEGSELCNGTHHRTGEAGKSISNTCLRGDSEVNISRLLLPGDLKSAWHLRARLQPADMAHYVRFLTPTCGL
jgi:hypothetical protein